VFHDDVPDSTRMWSDVSRSGEQSFAARGG
jgi:hypothetical protein